ncbi:MAG: cupin domain-containing protein [Gammaproteobacteria bacterium]|nr:cupin domain-containing protein [Gammaproteobacteria bacterium]
MKTNSSNTYTLVDTGPLTNTKNASFTFEPIGTINGKNFVKDKLNLSSMEVSINVLPPGTGMPFYHKHDKNEELYLFVKGQGQFQVDDDTFNVKEGSLVRVAPQGVRTWRNNGDEDLYYVVVQAVANSMDTGTISDGSAVQKEISWPTEDAAIPA